MSSEQMPRKCNEKLGSLWNVSGFLSLYLSFKFHTLLMDSQSDEKGETSKLKHPFSLFILYVDPSVHGCHAESALVP